MKKILARPSQIMHGHSVQSPERSRRGKTSTLRVRVTSAQKEAFERLEREHPRQACLALAALAALRRSAAGLKLALTAAAPLAVRLYLNQRGGW
jgi:hypothetical protein